MDRTLVKIVFYQILEAVVFIHRMGIIHHNNKPSNVLLSEDLSVKLCDFGSVVEINEKALKGEFDIEGFTKWYKAP
jgi:serine/threonine protein kinase